ncbi:hypothetical protein Droror1_Dr00014670 [Drosera rotundifolia]
MAGEAVMPMIELLAAFVRSELELEDTVRTGVQSLTRELRSIQAFLKDADTRAENDEGIKEWVTQVREIAFSIEDSIDEYVIVFGQTNTWGWMFKVVTRYGARHKLATFIQSIQKEVHDVTQRKNRYQFKTTKSLDRINHQRQDPRLISLYLEDSEVVGIDGPQRDLVSLLRLKDEEARRSVISIVGMGGLGKSTLVKRVYDDEAVRKNFYPHRAWISVSQCYERVELYRNVLKQFSQKNPVETDTKDEESLAIALKNSLKQKRYMIVFDDVWDTELWQYLRCALPDDQNGSKIVMTTKYENVASSWKESSHDFVYQLKPLTEGDAWNLFCKNAFRIDGGKCPDWLEELSHVIIKRFEGLPLAILATARFLSNKEKDFSEWKMFNDSFSFQLGRSLTDLSRILLHTYHDLPYYLKPCFLYFGIFPEDYQIDRMRVIRLWLAEGFLQARQNLTAEETGEQYLIELVHRNLIQVSTRDGMKRPRLFRVHDLYREWIVSKLCELRFCKVDKSKSEADGKFRRLSIHKDTTDSFLENSKAMHPNIRSLFVFPARETKMKSLAHKLLAHGRLLKVLDFQDAPISSVPDEIGDLYHLRYLNLRNTNVATLPSSVGKLQNLQTLDLRHSCVRYLPVEIKELHSLRHLLVYKYGVPHEGFTVPVGVICCLKELQKVAYIEIGDKGEIIEELRNLKFLRKLSIMKLKAKDGPAFCHALETMVWLETLAVYYQFPESLDLHHINNPPEFLKRLGLIGKMPKFPQWICKLNNLESLTLMFSILVDDPLINLQTLPNLTTLRLWTYAYTGVTLSFGTSGFTKLRVLSLLNLPNLEAMLIKQGALPALEELDFCGCSNLKRVPSGIQHLNTLSLLNFKDMPEDIMLSTQPGFGLCYPFVHHIPIVRHGITNKNTGEVILHTW